MRGILFFGYIVLCIIVFYKWLLAYIVPLFLRSRQISDENAAKNIGEVLPEIDDKLLNLLQLKKQHAQSLLLSAAIEQKSDQLQPYSFEMVIDFRESLTFLKYLILPFLIVLVVSVFYPKTITEPTQRILHFRQDFAPIMPFTINILNDNLQAFRNENFSLDINIAGSEIPEVVYIVLDNRRINMRSLGNSNYSHEFGKIHESTAFSIEAAGYSTDTYSIDVVNRPNIKNFTIRLDYPEYLNKKSDRLENTGDFRVPEGTHATWLINTTEADEIAIVFEAENEAKAFHSVDNHVFTVDKTLFSSQNYSIELKNKFSENKDPIVFNIELITDEFPTIKLEQMQDTSLYEFVVFGGSISDDYGISGFDLFYRNYTGSIIKDQTYTSTPIRIDPAKSSQSFYHHWNLTNYNFKGGEVIEYFLQVRDNDKFHGFKTANTPVYTFKVPTEEMLRSENSESSKKSENQIDKAYRDTKKLNEDLKQIEDKLKGKKELSWQDQKQLDDLMNHKEALDEAIKELQEDFNTEKQKRERFEQNSNPELKEKIEQLHNLMNELLDDETKKLYQELQKLLDEQKNLEDLKNVLDKLLFKEENLQKELERTLELFKKMKFEIQLEQNIQSTNELQQKQEQASENTENKSIDQESKKTEQKQLKQEFEQLKKDIGEMQQMNQELKNPAPMEDLSPEINSIEEQQEQAQDQLEQEKNKNAGKAQKGASDGLKNMSNKLQSLQSQMLESSMTMNMNQLRDILNNLIKLSFQQESIMRDFRMVNQNDPRYLELSQKQLKIKDDAQVIQDSLISMAKENFSIQSMVTRKVDEMNMYFDAAAEAIKERKKSEALGKQQFAMTAVNDLALMLDDAMTQMMNAMGVGGGKPQNARMPSMSDLQQQLGKKIEQLKKNGKSGRDLSEDLAKMAAEQEMIRKMLSDFEEQMNKEGNGSGNNLKDLKEKMEQNELDLVNKQLTDQLVIRQKEIVTRLLEAENAQKERDLDEERESEKAKNTKRSLPAAFDDYIKAKENEIELLKTIPPKLNPYYRKEVNQYFKRIEDK